jgi:MFS family permease
MRRIGRRAGFMGAAALGGVGSLLGTFAIFQRSFGMFLVGCLLIGLYQASSSYYRFAAADLASPAFRPKAISWVMTGGVAAALLGTLIVMWTVDMLAPVTFAGTWLAMGVLAFLAVVVLAFVDIPKQADTDSKRGRPLAEIARQPNYIAATGITMISFGVMMLVMTATPVAMLACGFTVQDSSWVIQWHALAMFVPSFFTGSLISRFGASKIITAGLIMLTLAGATGMLGISFGHFAIDLVLLGLGWNFGFIGGTTLLTTTYRPEERNKAQGLSDFLVFTTTALTSLSAGALMATIGWDYVNAAVLPMTALGLLVLWWPTRGRVATAG